MCEVLKVVGIEVSEGGLVCYFLSGVDVVLFGVEKVGW